MCPLFLSRHVLKHILGRKIGWHDLAFCDPVMYESLRQLVLDSEKKDANLLFTALDMNFLVELCAEEVRILLLYSEKKDANLLFIALDINFLVNKGNNSMYYHCVLICKLTRLWARTWG